MSKHPSSGEQPWIRSRYGFAAFCFLSLLASWLLLRLVLVCAFKPAGALFTDVLLAFLSGFHRDMYAALVELLPLMFWLLIVRDRSFGKLWHRIVFLAGCFIFWFAQIFLLFVEFFFFEEFRSRFNTVAVDYLIFPKETFVNIWESYHVAVFLGICAVLTVGWMWGANRLFGQMWERPFRARTRLAYFAAVVGLVALLTPTLDLKGAHVSYDRTVNELANNGAISFFAAAWTHNLDFAAFYKTMPMDEAYRRARRLLAAPNAKFAEEGHSIRRHIAGDSTRPRLNVVILLEESLGSEFWGCLGRKDTLTPEMDKLAEKEGMLFTDIYATGNRTVRGFEGVFSSFPPLPGDSIVRRDRSENVESIARVLKRDGYNTVFLYGGRGLFDDMRSYALHNGWDRFIEEKDFDHPTFSTIWGVCDEDTYARAIQEFHKLAETGKPFLGTILSVSNHKPYTYPKGRIPEDPDLRRWDYAVKYADYALGRFFDAAKKEAFWTNTIFVVVADHGARVYGEQDIPIHSYEIPVLIVGPAVVKHPSRVSELGCSLDVPTTILGLLGRPYDTQFFGRDLLASPPEDGRAYLNHNRDIGVLAHNRLVVLGLMKTVEFYQGDPKVVEMRPLLNPTDADREIEENAIAIYQVADDLYMHRRYRIDGEPVPQTPPKQQEVMASGH